MEISNSNTLPQSLVPGNLAVRTQDKVGLVGGQTLCTARELPAALHSKSSKDNGFGGTDSRAAQGFGVRIVHGSIEQTSNHVNTAVL